MIECTNCGFLNEEGDHFCGGCREPLQWTGRRIETTPDEAVVDEPEPADEDRPGIVERVIDRFTAGEDSPQGPTEGGVADTATSVEEAPPRDQAAELAAEAVARAEREAAEAERLQREAEARAREQADATERAQEQADAARQAREEAEQRAREEAAAADRIRAELEAARAAREQAADDLRREVEEAEQSRAEARLQAEREAMERAQAELERAEAARREAEERAAAEAAAAEAAAQQAAEAERARLEAEAKARADAEAAEQARRAAALVARPKPRAPAPEPTSPRKAAPSKPAKVPSAGPTPVKPDRAQLRKAPAKTRQAAPRLRPGDLVCGQCGEGNAPTRNFCRRCGNTLAEAEIVKRPWWQRWIPRRKPRVVKAGERPGRGGGKSGGGGGLKGAVRGAQGARRRVMAPIGKITRVLMLVAFAAAALGLSFNPSLRGSVMDTGRDLWDRVRGTIAPQFDPVTPIAVTASSARPDQADGFCCAANNVLQFGNTWWHASSGGVGQFLVITLDSPTDIAKFGIIPGAGDPAVWPEHPRPRDLEIDFLDEAGRTVTTTTITDIADEHESTSQIFDVSGAGGVETIRVTITRVYGEGLSSDDVAISEIRLLTRR